MARIRSVHPGFFTDEDLVSVSMAARLLFIGLGVDADDKGTFEWKPLTIKMKVFPADNVDVPALLAELTSVGAIKRYESGGRSYGAIRNFRKFQRPKTPNDINPCDDEIRNYVGLTNDVSETIPQSFGSASEIGRQMEDGGDKGIGSEAKASSHVAPAEILDGKKAAIGSCLKAAYPAKKCLIPEDWAPPLVTDLPPRARACAEQWTDASYQTEAEAFGCYWRSERKMKADWRGTWANRVIARHSAVMRDQKFGNAAPTSGKIELTAQQLRERAEWFVRHGQPDRADECRQKAVKLEQRTAA